MVFHILKASDTNFIISGVMLRQNFQSCAMAGSITVVVYECAVFLFLDFKFMNHRVILGGRSPSVA